MCLLFALLYSNVLSAQETTNFAAWKEPQNVSSIPDWSRRMLVRDFRDLSGDTRTKRLAEYLAELNAVVSDVNVVAPTRYNAILAIGQLVSEEATPGNPPRAYPAALPYLIDWYQKTDSPDYLKYGALLGIVRHTNCNIDPAQRDGVINLLLKIVTREAIGTPLEPEIWNWFRLTALDGLSALKTTGVKGNVAAALLAAMNQQSQKLEWLCQNQNLSSSSEVQQVRQTIELASKVAKTLGDLEYKPGAVEGKAVTDALIRLPKAVSDVEHIILGYPPAETGHQAEQMVIDIKTCMQSLAWGIRGGFLTSKPAEHSFYAALQNDEQAKRLDQLWSALTELSVFVDEGKKEKPPTTTPAGESSGMNVSNRIFKFDLPELRDTLVQFSETLDRI